MAVSAKQLPTPLPYSGTVGQTYSYTYLQGKAKILEQRLAWAKTELEQKYKSAEAYRKSREDMFDAVDKELQLLRKERATYDLKAEDLSVKRIRAARSGGAPTDDETLTKLLQQRREAAAAITDASVDISAQRVQLIDKAEKLFQLPTSTSDVFSKSVGDAQVAAQIEGGAASEAIIQDFVRNNTSVDAGFNGLTDEQKIAAAIDLSGKLIQAVETGKSGIPVTQQELDTINNEIASKYGMDPTDIDGTVLEARKKAKRDEYLRKAGATTAELKKTIAELDEEIARIQKERIATPEQIAEAKFDAAVKPVGDYLTNAVIEAVKNDGALDATEAAAIEQVMLERIGSVAASMNMTPENALAKYKKEYGLDAKPTIAESYAFSQIDMPVFQTYLREGQLNARQKELGLKPLEEPTPVVTQEDIMRRGAELYQPQRSRRGFGEIAPYYSQESATRRRAIEQGVPLTPSMGPAGRLEAPMQPVRGTVGRQAPVSTTPPRRFTGADELFAYTQMAQRDIVAGGGAFNKRTLGDTESTIAADIAKRLKEGSLKGQDLQAEVTRLTIGSGLYDDAGKARKAKEDILYNVIGEDYFTFINSLPKAPQGSPAEPVAEAAPVVAAPAEVAPPVPAPAEPAPEEFSFPEGKTGSAELEEEETIGGSPVRITPRK